MGVTTNLYVRHSLPLLQAREAMVAGKVKVSCTEVLGRMHATEWCVVSKRKALPQSVWP